ncbi:unnamed protein product [Closterium sp. NIES-54]
MHPPIQLGSANSAPFQLRPSHFPSPPAITLPTPPCGAASRSCHASTAPPPLRPVPPPTARQRLCRSACAPAHSRLARPLPPLGGCSAAVTDRADRRGRRGRVRAGSGWAGVGKGERQQGFDSEEGWALEEERDGEERAEGEEWEGEEGEGEEWEGEEGEDDLVEGGSVSLDNGFQFYSSDQGPSNPENRAAEFAAAAAAAAAAGGVAAAAGSGALPGSTSSSSSSTSTSSSATSSDSSSSSSSSGSSGGSSGGAGLYRVPVSGGVQSATAAHGLPSPAVAVRNLVEQARFAHLCSIMSRMHHRRKGYPFGSLVDFATDDEGHPIFLLSPLSIHTRNMLADPRCTLVVQVANSLMPPFFLFTLL